MPRLNDKDQEEGLKTERTTKASKTVAPAEVASRVSQKQVIIDLMSEQKKFGEKKDSMSST